MAESGVTVERVSPESVERVLARHRGIISAGLQNSLNAVRAGVHPLAAQTAPLLDDFYGQIEYHLGWRHPDLSPAKRHPGKLFRPALLLLGCDLAAARAGVAARERDALARTVVPAAVCVELIHNFSLVHDDIEDGDEERRHRPTLWKLWGLPQAINTGDGIFAIARAALWRLADEEVDPRVLVRLAALVDRTCVELCEGQYLDMSYEGRLDVTETMYLDMIGRKTASLMACSLEMGGRLGARGDEEVAGHLARFGRALGLAFQLRDDLLGIWAAEDELGKTPAGDLRRKKMSLPVIYALEHAVAADQETLRRIYGAPGEASEEQIGEALGVLQHAGARERVLEVLREQAAVARDALNTAAGTSRMVSEPRDDLAIVLGFVMDVVH